jgi:hypothetical protein
MAWMELGWTWRRSLKVEDWLAETDGSIRASEPSSWPSASSGRACAGCEDVGRHQARAEIGEREGEEME